MRKKKKKSFIPFFHKVSGNWYPNVKNMDICY